MGSDLSRLCKKCINNDDKTEGILTSATKLQQNQNPTDIYPYDDSIFLIRNGSNYMGYDFKTHKFIKDLSIPKAMHIRRIFHSKRYLYIYINNMKKFTKYIICVRKRHKLRFLNKLPRPYKYLHIGNLEPIGMSYDDKYLIMTDWDDYYIFENRFEKKRDEVVTITKFENNRIEEMDYCCKVKRRIKNDNCSQSNFSTIC